jgi:hemolysin III
MAQLLRRNTDAFLCLPAKDAWNFLMLDHDGRPLRLDWNYDRAEIFADGVVHVAGIVLALVGAGALTVAALYSSGRLSIVAVAIYLIGLVAALVTSATYNMWPISPVKWVLRRFDHSTIYLLIASTYTPFVAEMKTGLTTIGLLVGVWIAAIVGMIVKLALPGRFDRLSIGLYLLMGWSGLIAYPHVVAALPSSALWMLAAGGLFYSAGVIFHVWNRLRFQNAIWHSFVLVGAAFHYAAVFSSLS